MERDDGGGTGATNGSGQRGGEMIVKEMVDRDGREEMVERDDWRLRERDKRN